VYAACLRAESTSAGRESETIESRLIRKNTFPGLFHGRSGFMTTLSQKTSPDGDLLFDSFASSGDIPFYFLFLCRKSLSAVFIFNPSMLDDQRRLKISIRRFYCKSLIFY